MSAGCKRKGFWELKFSVMSIEPTANSWLNVGALVFGSESEVLGLVTLTALNMGSYGGPN